ncbi:P-loop NTPase fold protein [Actinosynnema sp. NPDC020468]|uniref:P-loop NTPase fold protein n=1 Tax=Actinosynnema sp. NPDC020468 TaxID=3154488 RepID=UPI0033F29F5C
MEPSAVRELGHLDGIAVYAAATSAPWDLDVEVLLVPVGDRLGGLGNALIARFPEYGVLTDTLSRSRPSWPNPTGVTMPAGLGVPDRLVLVRPRPDDGEVTAGSVRLATRNALEMVLGLGNPSVGIPLLGSGELGASKGMVASAVFDAIAEVAGMPGYSLRKVVVFDRAPDTLELLAGRWRARAHEGPVELAGGVSTDLVGHDEAIPVDRDRLGLAPYVSMLAGVIAERETPTPLSLGVFGEWGSGKSFFMGMLRARIGGLGGEDDARYCGRIVQIGFNAWHYADTNLWASLADTIFRGLADTDAGPRGRAGGLRHLLTDVTRRTEAEVARLTAEVDAARAAHVRAARDLLAGSRRVWRLLGVTDEAEQARLLSRQLEDFRAVPPHGRTGTAVAVAAAVVLAGSTAAGVVAPVITWLGGAVALLLGALGGGLLLRARAGLEALRSFAEDVRAGRHEGTADVVARLRAAEADEAVARAQLAEVLAGVAGHRDAYTRDLGVISALRKDFEQLVEVLAHRRDHPTPDGPPIDRIVLYVDDLDRCEPRQVVEVLEAVHLLLAVDLFVVVVGVDPRWLARSLRSHYAAVLDGSGPDPARRVTPEDYLEKIVNIPFSLPSMTGTALGAVIRSMADVRSPVRDEVGSRDDEPGTPVPTIGLPVPAESPPVEPSAPPHPLTDRELRFLEALGPLVDTPRAAKRLFNVYRMLRSSRDLGGAADFLGTADEPGAFQAVVVLLGILTGAPDRLDRLLDEIPGGVLVRDVATTWAEVHAGLRHDHERLHDGLRQVTALVTLPDLAAFRTWGPRVRRFTYTT